MADAAPDARVYENHLKGAYSVPSGDKVLAITDTSCYTLAEETAWLTGNIPERGVREDFLRAMSGLGIEDPARIFDRLLSIGALREAARRTAGDVFRAVVSPRIRLLPSRAQERFFSLFGIGPGVFDKALRFLAWPAAAGLAWGLLYSAAPSLAAPPAPPGAASGPLVIAIVIAASLVHELGHSMAAAAAGIGLRPIGFSVYLIYPVFYTNVSGIDKLKLREKALIDCGGFILQSVFLLGLLLVLFLTGSPSAAEAVRWIMLIIFFNLNPLFRTDGYWLYKDTYSELRHSRLMRAVHHVYLLAFAVFTLYFLWFVYMRLGYIWNGLGELWRSPGYFFDGGYKIILWAYFVFVGLAGGLNRFKEGRQEWLELRGGAGT
ncbi:MAG: hypothetical protein RDU13_03525 [Elusimicrobiales bacterium]|jgi:hypothetical protein|nr:hypothetical protein [Elusimicrobiales bacterium]